MNLDRRDARHGRLFVVLGFFVVCVLAACWPTSSCRAATPEQVDDAIVKGKAALWKAAKTRGGIWDDRTAPASAQAGLQSQWGGTTALCTYALLAAGESRDDPRLKEPIDFLVKSKYMTGVYAVGMRANVWPFLNTRSPEIREAIARDYKLLHSAVHASPDLPKVKAFYRYTVASSDYDHSASQYGVLGMWAIDAVGGEVPDQYWKDVETGWRKHQNDDGGWGYTAGKGDRADSYDTMTAAGVATLFITQDFLHSSEGIQCTGNISDPKLEKGLAWMSKNFNQFLTGNQLFYGLYGVERVGVASGYKYFGTTDWYAQGADLIIKRQAADGNWPGGATDTAFALLFLSRGRAPVAFNKLQYVIDSHGDKPVLANWNQRPRDVANLTKWMGKEIERFLNWQIVNLDAPIQDLHDAPILYIAGNQAVTLRDGDYDKLRQYVQEGGLIAGNADCNKPDFVQFFQKLGKTLFPAYNWIELPTDHVLYTEQFPRDKWANKPSIKVITNGSRILMVQLPAEANNGDFARNWQLSAYGAHEETFQFMDDLFLYAVDRGEKGGLENKGQTYVVRKKDNAPTTQSVKVARLKYDGNWDPEPAGWPRFAALLHNNRATTFDLDLQTIQPGDGKLTSGDFKIAHLTGTAAVKLSSEAITELAKFVKAGGTLFIDACGGSPEFASSLEPQLAAIVPGGTLDIVPPTDRIFGKPYPITEAEYRRYARRNLGNLHSARIKGIPVPGRIAVYFSTEDLSTALVGQQVDGIIGYAPATATAMLSNLASSYVKLPSTQPTTKPTTKTTTTTKK